MEDHKIPVCENEVDEGEHCNGEDGLESLKDVEQDQICSIDEGSKAEIEIPFRDWAEAVDNTKEKIRKDVEKNKGEKITSIVHDTENKNNARRMETYVSFVNRNWKRALTKFEKKKHTEGKASSITPSKHVNTTNEEALESSKYCSTPEGVLHSIWLQSLAKGEVVIEKRLPRKKPQSPYLVFCKEKEKELSHLPWKEFGIFTRKAWKELGDNDREKFKEKCKQIREKEREEFLASGNGTPEKKTKDKVLKNPRSAFNIYIDSLASEVTKFDATTGWNGLSEEEQKEFMEKEREELECYKMEMKEQKKTANKMRKRRNRVKNADTAVREKQEKHSAAEIESGDAIKKPRSAFSIFMDEISKEVKKTDDKEDAEDVKKRTNNQWRRLDKKEKESFRAKAVEEWTRAQPKAADVDGVITQGEGGPAAVEANGDGTPTTGVADKEEHEKDTLDQSALDKIKPTENDVVKNV